MHDIFAALFLTILGFVLIELVRPGSISSAINIFLLFGLSAGWSLVLVFANGEFSYRRLRSLLILAAWLIGVTIMIISATAPLEQVIVGAISFAVLLIFAQRTSPAVAGRYGVSPPQSMGRP